MSKERDTHAPKQGFPQKYWAPRDLFIGSFEPKIIMHHSGMRKNLSKFTRSTLMDQRKKKEIVTVYSSGNLSPVDERDKPRFIEKAPEKAPFDTEFDKRSVRVAEREHIERQIEPSGTIHEHIYRERFKKRTRSK